MQSRWTEPEEADDLGLRVYTSRLLGAESELVLHGGGNTSVKVEEKDHTGEPTGVLRIKGSGSDLAQIARDGFTGLRLEDLLAAKKFKSLDDLQMVDYFRKSMLDPSESSHSVEAFLHAFIPFKFVDHSHADSIIALTNTDLKDEEIRECLGNVVVVPYIAPGFELARALADRMEEITKADGIVLRKHGLFTYSESAKESYSKHIELVTKAEKFIATRIKGSLFTRKYDQISPDLMEFLPKLRGVLSGSAKKILHVNTDSAAVEVACSAEAEELCSYGPATPDMLIRTKHDFLYVPALGEIAEKVTDFAEKYRQEHSTYAPSYPMHDPYPSVILIRGFGIITQSSTKKAARIIMDQAMHSFTVNAKCRKLGKPDFISKTQANHMEYWPLQEAKLKKFVPRKLQGIVSVVTGAAGGIGLEAFTALAQNGSHVIALDVDPAVVGAGESLSKETKIENLSIQTDLGNEDQIRMSIEKAVREFGGVDVVFNNAGILKTA